MNRLDIDEEIRIPEELNIERIRSKVTRRAARRSALIYTRNIGIALAASLALFLGSAIVSPKIATIAADIPLIGHFFQDLGGSKGYADALNNDYAIEIHDKKQSDDLDLELSYVMADQQNIILFFTSHIKNDKIKDNNLTIEPKTITDKTTGKEIDYAGATLPSISEKEYGVSVISMGGMDYSTELTIEVNVHNLDTESYTAFSYDLSLPELPAPKEYNINKTFTVREQKFTVKKIELYPTTAIVDILYDKNNTMEILSMDFTLKNNTGDSWKNSQNGVIAYEKEGGVKYVIDGGYYSSTDELDLVIDSVELLPDNKKMVTYNYDTNTFTDETGEMNLLDSYSEENSIYYKLKGNEEEHRFFQCALAEDGSYTHSIGMGLHGGYSFIEANRLEGNVAKLIRCYPEYVENINEVIGLK